jgi:hypothetical protein
MVAHDHGHVLVDVHHLRQRHVTRDHGSCAWGGGGGLPFGFT